MIEQCKNDEKNVTKIASRNVTRAVAILATAVCIFAFPLGAAADGSRADIAKLQSTRTNQNGSAYAQSVRANQNENDSAQSVSANQNVSVYAQGEVQKYNAQAKIDRPKDPITRAEFLKLFAETVGLEKVHYESDLKATWYADYVNGAYEAGVFDLQALSFLPNDGYYVTTRRGTMDRPISRYDAASILAWGLNRLEAPEIHFLDEEYFARAGSNLRTQVYATVDSGLMLGYKNGSFVGWAELTRAQAEIIMQRLQVLVDTGRYRGSPYQSELRYNSASDAIFSGKTIVHGCGRIIGNDGKEYIVTNSVEALETAYLAGHRCFEVDLLETVEGDLICQHDGYAIYVNGIPHIFEKMTNAQVLGGRADGYTTPLCVDGLANFMRQHKDTYIVTDTKGPFDKDLGIIENSCPDLLDRIVIQIYADSNYDIAVKHGFNNIIYTLYRHDKDLSSLRKFVKEHKIMAYAYDTSMMDYSPSWVKSMWSIGVPILIYTPDGTDKAKWLSRGAAAVYTNDI